jgi:hypothetical protein
MKTISITISLLSILLLILTPSIPAIQCTTLIGTNATQRMQPIERNELKEKRSAIQPLSLNYLLKTIPGNEKLQQFRELLPNNFKNTIDKFLRILLLCTFIISLITYAIGNTLGTILEKIVYLITRGERAFPNLTSIVLIPSEFFSWICMIIYEIGMNVCDWPIPGDPGGH